MIRRCCLLIITWLGFAPFLAAQPSAFRHELLSLLPNDFAVCVVMNDLRGHSARWEQSDWLKAFRQTPVGKSLLAGPEFEQITRWQDALKTHFDLDWPTLRDDILGDTLILSYSPGSKSKPEAERGLFLLHARRPERFVQFIDRLNDAQKKSGELSSLTKHEFQGQNYFRRVQDKKSHSYFVRDHLAVLATTDDMLRGVIERLPKQSRDNPWAKRFQRAGAESAFLTMCVNPRALDADVVGAGKKDDALPSYWSGLEAIFVTASIRTETEVRLSIQADPKKLPEWAKVAFTETIPTSTLWQHFPEKSILTVAAKTDFAGTADALKLLMPEKDRKKIASDWQGGIGAILPIDPLKDLLPNIGPDWGLCILPPKDAKQLPQAMFALAVKPGPKEQPIDQGLFKGVEFFADLALFEHNKSHPNRPLRLRSVMQGKVEVKYLVGDKTFPPGLQPAAALKAGFLILATSPDAIAKFRAEIGDGPERKEAPLVRLSAQELATLLEHRRDHILAALTDRQQMSEKDARKHLEDVVSVLRLFDRLTLSHRGEAGQASWILRVTPAK